jgi:hypothetical protein
MIPFVTKPDLDVVKHVADSVKNTATWPQFVIEAQRFDVKHWIGDALLNEIDSQLSTSPGELSVANQKLMDGGSYTYQNKTYLFGGLKLCIIYYAIREPESVQFHGRRDHGEGHRFFNTGVGQGNPTDCHGGDIDGRGVERRNGFVFATEFIHISVV